MDGYFEHCQNCPQVSLTDIHPYVNIELGIGLVPSGNKPLPELIFNKIFGTIWHLYHTMSSMV